MITERRRLRSIVVDCAKPAALARFWAVVLEYQVRPYNDAEIEKLRAQGITNIEDDPSVAIEPADEVERREKPNVWFEQVPEPKAVKNRLHIDINLRSHDELDRFVALGARVIQPFGAKEGIEWAILADPEGNEFCVFPPDDE
jgi:hypothetical protein